MRILSLVSGADVGGAEIHVDHIVRHVDAEHLVVTLASGPLMDRWSDAGAKVILLRTPSKIPSGSVYGMEHLLAKYRPDVVHSHQPKAHALAALSRMRCPRVMTIHGSHRQFASTQMLPSAVYRWADLWACRGARAVISVCEADRQELAAHGFPKRKLRVVFNGVPDPGVFDGAAARPLAPTEIVWVGRFSPEKRPELMAEIARLMAEHPRVSRIRMIGAEQTADLRSDRVLKLSIERAVVPLSGVWANAAVLVNTSLAEGTSLVMLEALASGVPVVASAVGGNAEVVGDAGLAIVEKESRGETARIFASALKRLLEDENFRWKLALKARARYLEKFTVARMAAELTGLYRDEIKGMGAA